MSKYSFFCPNFQMHVWCETELCLLLTVYFHAIKEKSDILAAEFSQNKPSTLNTAVMAKGKRIYSNF